MLSAIQTALPLAVAFASIARAQTLSSNLDHESGLVSLGPGPPQVPRSPGTAPPQLGCPHPLLLTDRAWQSSSADSSLKLFPVLKVGVSNALRAWAPLASRSASPFPLGQSAIEKGQVLKTNVWTQRKTAEKTDNYLPSLECSLSLPRLSRESQEVSLAAPVPHLLPKVYNIIKPAHPV